MKTKKIFGIAEKLEIVQTRQQGLSLADVAKMYGASRYPSSGGRRPMNGTAWLAWKPRRPAAQGS